MAQTIFFMPPARRFTRIPNDIDTDKRLSMNAIGVLKHVLSKPKDWEVSADYLTKALPIGRDAAREALKLLEKCGYARQERNRVRGRFVSRWSFHYPALTIEDIESPRLETSAGNPSLKTSAGSPALVSRALHKTVDQDGHEDGQPPAAAGGGASASAGESCGGSSRSQGRKGDASVLDEGPERKRKTHTLETDKPLILAALDKHKRGETLKPEEVALIGWASYCDHFENKVAAYATTRRKLMPVFTETAKEDGTTAEELMFAVDAWIGNPRVTVRTSAGSFRAFGLEALQEGRAKRSVAVSGPPERGLGIRHQASRDNFDAAISQMSEQQLAEYL
ncbi:helix-turn-helix domain-containing protein [Actinomadura monticuli]|uniref:Helix-turn-helix domain-containing protein n=1 Tax=Actinomadura monticuli TaxID=3097367 RepID=A0ABV4Q7U1_9ACTN